MTQLERIHFIYQALEGGPASADELYGKLRSQKVKVGQRQIYHDLEQIRKFYLREEEQLVHTTGQFNRKTYRLIKPTKEIALTARDITTFQLARAGSSRMLQQMRTESMDKFREVYKSMVKMNSSFYHFMTDDQNTRSFFYESLYDEAYNQKLDDFIWAIANYKKVKVNNMSGDPTCIPQYIEFPFYFKPLMLIYHRGNHFIQGYHKNKKTFFTIDLSKVNDYALTQDSFFYKKIIASAKTDLDNKLGITNNIDDKVYKIELEFSSITGEFVRHYHWHKSQRFIQLPGGNWLLKMECGINRELVGWIFHWMGNIRINGPEILLTLYKKQLCIIENFYNRPGKLFYNNSFKRTE